MHFWTLLLLVGASEALKNATVCKGQTLGDARGVVTTPNYPQNLPHPILTHCAIHQPEEAVTTVRILSADLNNQQVSCQCCNFLEVRGTGSHTRRICDDKKYNPFLIKGTINITFQYNFLTSSGAKFAIHYTANTMNNCGVDQFACMTTDGCFRSEQICDGIFNCRDHSDEINCAFCLKNASPCNTNGNSCFDILEERCNGVFNCPRVNDEVNCFSYCTGGARCKDGTGCFFPEQVCDGKPDCLDTSDEFNCSLNYCELHPKKDLFICQNERCISRKLLGNGKDDCGDNSDETVDSHRMLVGISVSCACLLGLFVAILCCWCNSRRDIDNLIANLPEFPLPPFQGPGESSTHCNLACESFELRGDEEMFEAYLETRSESGSSRRRQRSTRSIIVRPSRSCSIIKTNTNCTAITLASLGVEPEDCLNLDPVCGEHHSNHFEFLESFCKGELVERKRTAVFPISKVPSKKLKLNRVDCAGDRLPMTHLDLPEHVLHCKPSTSGYKQTVIDVELT